ncbi:MAG: dihydroxy-acid dehydratase, partial [Candidatus Coatesbacteria bacterium]|nr:dihydroxy-acid dehydratase [Candidatus Coatesbacteria bacterium]
MDKTNERRELTSQRARERGYEVDGLRLGCGWTQGELTRPLALVESCYGHSHPGSIHLDAVTQKAYEGLLQAGLTPAKYFCSDVCDGITQGTDAMRLSLASREVIAHAAELHGKSAHADGVVFVSSCDKAIPGHLIAGARLDLPTAFALGGVMSHGSHFKTLEAVVDVERRFQRGAINRSTRDALYEDACPTAGACAFMGTACTMQIMAEALGLALPGTALFPAASLSLLRLANETGHVLAELLKGGVRFSDIVTRASLKNALTVLAAVGGSTNALLHLAALANVMGFEFSLKEADAIFASTPLLCDIRPSGRYPSDFFWQAGGLPRVIMELGDALVGSAKTITGMTLAESAECYIRSRPVELAEGYLNRFGLAPSDIIRPVKSPLRKSSPIAILFGNLAPNGAVGKRTSDSDGPRIFSARVFDDQESALRAISTS